MDFQITEEQNLIKQSIQEFVQETVDNDGDSIENFKSLADIEFLGIFLPEKYGGADSDFTSFILSIEEIAKDSASLALLYATHCCLAEYSIHRWGSEELKQKYLPVLCSGSKIGGFAYNEGCPGVDWALISSTAEENGEDYIINGKKTYLVNAEENTLFIVFAHTKENELSAFVVDGETEGVSFGPEHQKMGLEGACMSDVTLHNVKIPRANLIGKQGQGKAIADAAMSMQNVALGGIAVGISQSALDKSITYGKERVQFGRPIIKFEALQEMIGKMAVNTEAARLLVYKAAGLKDQGKPCAMEAEIARYFAQTTGELACIDAIQIHGGYGYSKDLGVDRLLRDIKGIGLVDALENPIVIQIAGKATD